MSHVAALPETMAAGSPLGLTDQEAAERRARGQGNRIANETSRTYGEIVKDNLLTFINVTLIAIGLLLIAMGLTRDAIMASGLAVLNALFGIVQEARSKRRLDRIALINRAQATIVREGAERRADPSEIVVGDVLAVAPGDQIMVDGRVVGDGRMEVDESLLSGEADPVPKRAGDPVFSGSFCVSGGARYVAEKVGADSIAASIAAGARAFKAALTPLQRTVNLIVRLLLVIAAFFLVMILLGSAIHDYPFRDTVVAAAVVVGIVPSGLFLMITVTYSMAAVRLASRNALIQQANAVESLSNVNVFCMDKTGTLTANKLNLTELSPIDHDEAALRPMLGAFAASATGGTKTSQAIAAACGGGRRPVVEEIPFSSARKWSALAADDDALRGVFALGAPEMLAPHLQDGTGLRPPAGWTDRGLRVLLFARSPEVAPLHRNDGEPGLPPSLAPVAWLGFTDELRPHSKETLDGFRDAGLALKIISGDNPETVAALARQAGLPPEAALVSGPELAEMGDADFAQAAAAATVFGRITPEQKARLVRALRDRGHYVAMTGDGVNDVLSLKEADLGIAMQSGSQATRAAADIVLLDDAFGALPAAFAEGQRIRRGLLDVLDLFLTRVFVVALVILAVVFVQGGFPFSPGHMTLLTLLTVAIPSFGLALWATPGAAPPNLVRSLLRFVLPATVLLTVAAFGIYALFYFRHDLQLPAPPGGVVATSAPPQDLAKDALTYVLILGGLWLVVFSAPPTRFWAVVEETTGDWRPTLLALAMLPLYALIVAVPWLRDFFGVHVLAWGDYVAVALVVAALGLLLRFAWQSRAFDRFFGYAE